MPTMKAMTITIDILLPRPKIDCDGFYDMTVKCLSVVVNPSQIHQEMAINNHQHVPTFTSCCKPSRWRQPPRITKETTADATTSATRCTNTMQMHLDALLTQLDDQQSREKSGSVVLSALGVYKNTNGQESHPKLTKFFK
jgi:hypothetical protein